MITEKALLNLMHNHNSAVGRIRTYNILLKENPDSPKRDMWIEGINKASVELIDIMDIIYNLNTEK